MADPSGGDDQDPPTASASAGPGRDAGSGAGAPIDPDALQARLDAARERFRQGQAGFEAAARELAALLPHVTSARGRGAINQALWDAARALGRRPHHFSQSGQDAWLDERVFKGKRGGSFVEIGGYDGITGSNCLFFELMRGWSGLLIEPSPSHHAAASAIRRCPCLRLAVAGRTGEAEFLEIREGLSQMGGLIESYDEALRRRVEADPRHEGGVIRVETRPLAAILGETGLREIDYISLDVEGGELAVLEAFPFDAFAVTAWTIENNRGTRDVPELMADHGYRRVEALGVDDVYLRTPG